MKRGLPGRIQRADRICGRDGRPTPADYLRDEQREEGAGMAFDTFIVYVGVYADVELRKPTTS